MVGSYRKEDVLFVVSALSDGLFDSEKDGRALSKTIGDYFVYSDMEAETDNECDMWILSLLLIYWHSEWNLNFRLPLTT